MLPKLFVLSTFLIMFQTFALAADFGSWKPNFLTPSVLKLHDEGFKGERVEVLVTEDCFRIPHIPVFNLERSVSCADDPKSHAVQVTSVLRKTAPFAKISICHNYVGQQDYEKDAQCPEEKIKLKENSEAIWNSSAYHICNMSWAWCTAFHYKDFNANKKRAWEIIRINKLWRYPDFRNLGKIFWSESSSRSLFQQMFSESYDELLELDRKESFFDRVINADIYREYDIWEALNKRPDTLFVRSIGNDGEKLIYKGAYFFAYAAFEDSVFNLDNMIWVACQNGTCDKPGEEFKDHTLCARAKDVDVMRGDQIFIKENGSSLAAPNVAGVAAIIKGAFFSFTPFDLKTCLLESADTYRIDENGVRIELDPLSYGRGILNAQHAFLYARALHDLRQGNISLRANDISVKETYLAALAHAVSDSDIVCCSIS